MKNLFIIAAVTASLVACGKGKNKNPIENIKQATADRDLQNSFQSECSTNVGAWAMTGVATAGKASVKTTRVDYKFEGANVTRRLLYFTGAKCDGEAFDFIETGDFSVDKDKKTSDGGYHIDMHFKTVEAKAMSQDGATIASALAICDKRDWRTGDKVDVTKQSGQFNCYSTEEPRDVANIYRVDNGNLFLGDSGHRSIKPNARPQSLENEGFSQK